MKYKTYLLRNEAILNHFVSEMRPLLDNDNPLSVTPKAIKRTLDQNAAFHRLCGELEKHKVEWAGKPRTLASWKVLLVSGHAIATNGEGEVLTGLEGELVSIRESTADMDKKRSSSLLEYTIAFCAGYGIE